jgi:hypothetical protein
LIESAVLVEPDTSVAATLPLPSAYRQLSLVTDIVGGPGGTDVALLWNGSVAGSGVALWTLGKTAGQPYRSVEVLGIQDPIAGVVDVPAPRVELKLLQTEAQSDLYVLNLESRTAAPLTSLGQVSLSVAPDAGRMWAYQPGTSQLASVDLDVLHPIPLFVDRPIASVFDVARADGGRALITVHAEGGVGATVFDALTPDTATSRLYSALLLQGI